MAGERLSGIEVAVEGTTTVPEAAAEAQRALKGVESSATGAGAASRSLGISAEAANRGVASMAQGMGAAQAANAAFAQFASGNVIPGMAMMAGSFNQVRGAAMSAGTSIAALAMNPLVLAAAAIAGLTVGVYAASKALREAEQNAERFGAMMGKNVAALRAASIASMLAESKALAEEFKRTGVETERMAMVSRALGQVFGFESEQAKVFNESLSQHTRLAKAFGIATDGEVSALYRNRREWEALKGTMSDAEWARGLRAVNAQIDAALALEKATKGARVEAEKLAKATQTSDWHPAPKGYEGAIPLPMVGQKPYTPEGYGMSLPGEFKAQADLAKQQQDQADLIKGIWTDALSGIGNAWGGFWEDMAAGAENPGQRLVGAILKTIGQIAIQYGTMMVLAGSGLAFIPGFQTSAGAVPYGLALIAMGGAAMGVGSKIAGGAGASSGASSRGPLTDRGYESSGVRRPGEPSGGTIVVNVHSGQALTTGDDVAVMSFQGVRRALALGHAW